jgi:hypothetical protein
MLTEFLVPIHPTAARVGFPHCLVKIEIAPHHCPVAPHHRSHHRPTIPHHRPASLTTAQPLSPPPSRPHHCPAVPGPAAARLPLRAPGRLPPGPTAARCLPPGPCSAEVTASSMTMLDQPEWTPSWQPIALTSIVGPDLHCWPHFLFAHVLNH